MRIRATSKVHVDLITTSSDVAELAKASQKFGYRMTIEPDNPGSTAEMVRTAEWFGSDDLAAQVFLQALCDGRSPIDVLDGIRARLVEWGVNVEVPPADTTPIGEGDQ